jgi:hypothetical protein
MALSPDAAKACKNKDKESESERAEMFIPVVLRLFTES